MVEQPTETVRLFFQGNECMAAGEDERAVECFEHALRLSPDFAPAHTNLALIQVKRKQFEQAETHYRQAIAFDPCYSESFLNLGVLLAAQKRFTEAESAYLQAIGIRPESVQAWTNLGVLYACMHREIQSEQCYRRAMTLDKSYALARFNLSYLLLRQGRFEEGWLCLEARDWYAPLVSYLACPRWQGESLAGKTILMSFEAGLGDVIQFCRYAAELKRLGASSVTLICHPPLKLLMESMPSINRVISFDEYIPNSGWDYWTPLLSIPYFVSTRLASIPAEIPYLFAPSDRVAHWAAILPQEGFKVGLVWKGNPLFENDADRSLPSLQMLAPLWQVPGVYFFSLQKGAGEQEAIMPPDGQQLIAFGPQLHDFAETAAVVMNLDLVISVDTAVAHLAGALGKVCWLLLPSYKPDWRWLKDRTDSPWYPEKMRLFRQIGTEGWAKEVDHIRNELEKMLWSGVAN